MPVFVVEWHENAHKTAFFYVFIWSIQKKAVPLHPLLKKESLKPMRNRMVSMRKGIKGSPKKPSRKAVLNGESGGLEDYNESVA